MARGRTFSSTDVHLLEVFQLFKSLTNFPIMVRRCDIFQANKAVTKLGLSLGKLQLGSRREKVLQEEEKVKFELHKIRS